MSDARESNSHSDDSHERDSTSVTLLGRLKSNDPAAWERLSQLYGPMVYAWARRANLQPEDAADVTQTVFQAVFTGFHRFRKEHPGDRFRDWLWTITRHRVIDHVRKLRSAAIGMGGSTAQMQWQQLPEDLLPEEVAPAIEVSETTQLVRRALELARSEFELRTWQACWKTTVEGLAVADVAAELQMSTGAIYVARSRVLKRIREELEGLVQVPADSSDPEKPSGFNP